VSTIQNLFGEKMNTNELIEALDQRYGNPHVRGLELIQEAIKVLRLQAEEITALMEQLNELTRGQEK
jgi:predicted phage tail protein